MPVPAAPFPGPGFLPSSSCPTLLPFHYHPTLRGLPSNPRQGASQYLVSHCALGVPFFPGPHSSGLVALEEEWSPSSPDMKRVELDVVTESLWCRRVHEGGAGPPQSFQWQAQLRDWDLLGPFFPAIHTSGLGSSSEPYPSVFADSPPPQVLRQRGGAPKPRAKPATVAASSHFLGRRVSCPPTHPPSTSI